MKNPTRPLSIPSPHRHPRAPTLLLSQTEEDDLEHPDLETLNDLEAVTPARDRIRQLLCNAIHSPSYFPQEVEHGIRDLTATMEYSGTPLSGCG